jgi:hypothetical protein
MRSTSVDAGYGYNDEEMAQWLEEAERQRQQGAW